MGGFIENVPEGSQDLLRQSDDLASNEFKNFTKLVDPWQKKPLHRKKPIQKLFIHSKFNLADGQIVQLQKLLLPITLILSVLFGFIRFCKK